MKFELKILLLFAALILVMLFSGFGSMSFDEAKSRAAADRVGLSADQLSILGKKQARFLHRPFLPVLIPAALSPTIFTLVVEIGVDGLVSRSWRQGDSNFGVCFQRLMTEYF